MYSLKLAFRNALKNKQVQVFSIIGLTIALLTVAILTTWIYYEFSFDRFHSKSERIYRFTIENTNAETGYKSHFARCWQPWRGHVPEHFAGIECMTELHPLRKTAVRIGVEKFYTENAFVVDSSLFNIFDIEFIAGNPENCLMPGAGVIISESIARKYFGNMNPLGKEISITGTQMDREENLLISGIIKDLPANSHFHLDIAVPISSNQTFINKDNDWAYCYLLLHQSVNIAAIESQIPAFKRKYLSADDTANNTLHFQTLKDIHLKSHKDREIERAGDPIQIWIAIAVMLGILFISLVNFINLTIALYQKRRSGISVGFILGNTHTNYVLQSLLESFLVSIIATAFAALLFGMVSHILYTRYFLSAFLFETLSVNKLLSVFVILLIIATFCGTLPSIFIGRKFKGLNRNLSTSGSNQGDISNRLLLTGQFFISIIIISFSLMVYRQNKLIENTYPLSGSEEVIAMEGLAWNLKMEYPTFKEKALKIAGVTDVTAMMELPLDEFKDGMTVRGGDIARECIGKLFNIQIADDNLIRFLNLKIIAGNDFPSYNPDSKIEYFLLNESAVKQLGFSSPEAAIGKRLEFNSYLDMVKPGIIQGVVKDFHIQTIHQPIKPMVFLTKPIWYWCFLVKTNRTNLKPVIKGVQGVFIELYPQYPFDYITLADQYNYKYRKEKLTSGLLLVFSILSIFISCLGLIAIVNQTIDGRTKEIGIRKVNGARVSEILSMVNKDFVKWVVVSFLAACPMAYYVMQKWLQNFSYKVEPGWWIFVLAGSISIGFVVLTITIQSFTAANKNPVEALRNE